MLQYTLDKMTESHIVLIERNVSKADAFGAIPRKEWELIGEYEGLFWWWPVRGEGGFREEADEERTINVSGGGAILERTCPVRNGDRVRRVLMEDGTEVEGPYRVVSVRETPTHKEISVIQP